MKKIIALAAVAVAVTFAAAPVMAADSAACQASWTKMDAKKQGYVMAADASSEVAAMTKAGKKMAAADRMSGVGSTEPRRRRLRRRRGRA